VNGEESSDVRAALGVLLKRLRRAAVDGVVPEGAFLAAVRELALGDDERERVRDELARLGLPVRRLHVHTDGDSRGAEKVARVGGKSEENVFSARVMTARALLARYADAEGRVASGALEGVVRLAGLDAAEAAELRAAVRVRVGRAEPAGGPGGPVGVVPGSGDAAADVPVADDAAPDVPDVADLAEGPDGLDGAMAAARAVLETDRLRRGPEKRLLSAEAEVGLAVLLRGGPERIAEEASEEELKALPGGDLRIRARDCLVVHNLRLVHSLVRSHLEQGLEYEDLVQHGVLGLMRAARKFDPRMGNKFSTYATWWIRQSMSRAVADEGALIRIPVHMHEQVRKVAAAERNLAARGRPTTAADVAVACDMTLEKVEHARRLSRRTDSLDRVIGDGATLADFVARTHALPPVEKQVVGELFVRDVLDVVDTFTEREARILVRRLGLDGQEPSTLDELGGEFGVTRERIRQIEAKVRPALRERLREVGLVGLDAACERAERAAEKAAVAAKSARYARATQAARTARARQALRRARAARLAGAERVTRTESATRPESMAGTVAESESVRVEPVPAEPVTVVPGGGGVGSAEAVRAVEGGGRAGSEEAVTALPGGVETPVEPAPEVSSGAEVPAEPVRAAPDGGEGVRAGKPGVVAADWTRALRLAKAPGGQSWLAEYALAAVGQENLVAYLGQTAAEAAVRVARDRQPADRPVLTALEVLRRVFDHVADAGLRPEDFFGRPTEALRGTTPGAYLATRPLVNGESRLAVRDALREFLAAVPARPEETAQPERAEQPEVAEGPEVANAPEIAAEWGRALTLAQAPMGGGVPWLAEYAVLALGQRQLTDLLGSSAGDAVVRAARERGTLDRPVVRALEALREVFDGVRELGLRPEHFFEHPAKTLAGATPRAHLRTAPLTGVAPRRAVREALREFTARHAAAPAAERARVEPPRVEPPVAAVEPPVVEPSSVVPAAAEPVAAEPAIVSAVEESPSAAVPPAAVPPAAEPSAAEPPAGTAPLTDDVDGLVAGARTRREVGLALLVREYDRRLKEERRSADERLAAVRAEGERQLDAWEEELLHRADQVRERRERHLQRQAEERLAQLKEQHRERLRAYREGAENRISDLQSRLADARAAGAEREPELRQAEAAAAERERAAASAREEYRRGAQARVAELERRLRESEAALARRDRFVEAARASAEEAERQATERIVRSEHEAWVALTDLRARLADTQAQLGDVRARLADTQVQLAAVQEAADSRTSLRDRRRRP
jgi:RNA polymerase sigma factor (sigma-70 family)